jgi:hypothetical protein
MEEKVDGDIESKLGVMEQRARDGMGRDNGSMRLIS